MGKKRKKSRFTIRRTYSAEPMSLDEWRAAEKVLARLVAEAYAADHPEIFGPVSGETSDGVGGQIEPAEKDGGPDEDLQE